MMHVSSCRLCPRNCGADRRTSELSAHRDSGRPPARLGFCGESDKPRVALATLHGGEEPPLCGTGGSGAVFFSGCTLKCSFCQNVGISRGGIGRGVAVEDLAGIFLALESKGAENLNLVTGTHFLPAIAEGLGFARARGLALPVLWNSSGYENEAGLNLIESFTDVYLPDLKTLDAELAAHLFNAPDYPEAATAAVLRMAKAAEPELNGEGILMKGTIVRHLVLPGLLKNARQVLEWFAENLSGRAWLSLMFQYLPPAAVHLQSTGARSVGESRQRTPARGVEDSEYYSVIGMLEDLGIEDGFVQEPEDQSPWMPSFERDNPFPDEYSRVVWHWRHGFAGV